MLRLWLAMVIGAGLLLASGVIASMARAQPGPDPMAVITGYEMARNRGDVDTAMTFFADNAVITQRNSAFSGKDEVRKFLDAAASRSRFIVVQDRHASGNVVSWTERSASAPVQSTQQPARPQPAGAYTGGGAGNAQTTQGFAGRPGAGTTGNVTPQAAFTVTVEAVVQDGKILSMSYTFGNQLTRPDPALEGRAQLPASIGLAAVLGVLLSMLMIASTGLGRATPTPSTLRGRLMQDLQGWSAARQ